MKEIKNKKCFCISSVVADDKLLVILATVFQASDCAFAKTKTNADRYKDASERCFYNLVVCGW